MPKIVGAAVIACSILAVSAAAVEWTDLEGTARGFPVLRDMSGKKLADGDFVQWIERAQLHVRIRYAFGDGRSVEETAVFRQTPQLIQDGWSLHEVRNGMVFRHFEVNFGSGTATAQKREEKGLERWSEKVDVEPGRTFAGFGFTLATKGLRKRLVGGEHVELQAVGFTPKPRRVAIDVSYAGSEQLRMAQRTLKADRFVIHPKIPWFAELFIDVPDISIWLTPPPAGFLRFEGPLAEPKDPIIRIDGLPGS